MRAGILKMRSLVLESCRVSPSMVREMRRLWGSGTLVGGGDGGAEGGEGGEGFSERPLRGGELDVAGADVVDDGVAEDILLPVFCGDLVAGFADDYGELGFVVGLLADPGEDDGVVGSYDGA